ncbi:V-type proton ATPase subunit c'' [Rhodotorula sphaerocarpa]
MGYTTSLAAYSTVSLAALFAGYILFTGSGTQFNPGAFLEQTSPYVFALTGMGLNIGLSVAGAGWGIWITGASILGGSVRTPRIRTKNLISGVITSIVFSAKLVASPTLETLYTASNYYTGYALFWGGLTSGVCNLLCGIAVGISGSNAALADAADPQLFVKARRRSSGFGPSVGDFVLVIEVFSSILGLFGLIVALLMSGKAADFA